MDQPLAPNNSVTVALGAIVTELESVERAMRELEAARMRLLAEAFELAAIEGEEIGGPERHVPSGPRGELALRAIRAEIAVVLGLSERTVDRHLAQAYTLTRQFPAVFAALQTGEVSRRHAGVICDSGHIVGTGDDADALIRRGEYSEKALIAAEGATPATLAARSKRIAEHYAETSLDERHEAARKQRRVWVEDREDGMVDLFAHLPATEAYAIKDRLTRLAKHSEERELSRNEPSLDEPRRCRDEIRADILADLLLGRTGETSADEVPAVQAVVQVLVNANHLAMPELEGHGPIDILTARELAADADHWELIRTDMTGGEAGGEILKVDRYRPSEQMRRMLCARDRHCRFPGCRVPVTRCDLDHTVDAQHGGSTSTDNRANAKYTRSEERFRSQSMIGGSLKL
jgi:hypothetical protein